jgi:hypothetical protein
MESPLTKSQLCWVVIRGVGVYLLVQAIVSLSVAILSAMAIGIASSAAGLGSGTLGLALPLLFSAFVSGLVGYYLLLRGASVHRLMMTVSAPSSGENSAPTPRRPVDPDEIVDPATTLSQRESREFAAWLEAHPELRERSETDRIALFRDAQAERNKS